MPSLHQPPLYVKLYLWFLLIVGSLGLVSFVLVLALGSGKVRPPGPTYGNRMLQHLTRAFTGVPDEAALREAVEGAHDDLDFDIVVLDANNNVRVAAGQPVVLPSAELLAKARQRSMWMPPTMGIVAGPLDAGLLLLRFPGVTAQRTRTRRLALGAIGLLVAAALLYPLSRSITRPLEKLTAAAEAFGKGDPSARSGIDRRDEVGQLARTFDEMAARVQAARRAERELLANVSHELRTPLARLQVALELLNAKDEATERRVASIREEVEELDRLIADVLTTSRLDLSPSPLQRHDIPLRTLVERSRDRALALEPDQDIQLDVPPDLHVAADEALLARVVDNLLDNARKYGGPDKPIRVQGSREGASVLLSVQDGGPGFAAGEVDKVFEPFFRGDTARASAAGGFGLGLALARRIAEAHGGSIKAGNAPEGGARLEVRLPPAG